MTCSVIQFGENNFAALADNYTYSSQNATSPFTNSQNDFLAKPWIPTGYFGIDNKKIYINDGTDKEATINGDFTTPAALATEIQTQLNAASSNWAVSYSGDYKFIISNSGTVTLRLSETTDSIMDLIGFTTISDISGTTFTANRQINHTSEFVRYDLGGIIPVDMVAILSDKNSGLDISSFADVRLQGNNLDEWDAPPLDQVLTPSDSGIFYFFEETQRYRYYRIVIQDKQNPRGPEALKIGHIYLGPTVKMTNKNIQSGFEEKIIDPSTRQTSDDGTLYHDEKFKYSVFSGLNLLYLSRSDKDNFKRIFKKVGITRPFFISFDPQLQISDTHPEFTKFVVFEKEPSFSHVKTDIFSASFELREII